MGPSKFRAERSADDGSLLAARELLEQGTPGALLDLDEERRVLRRQRPRITADRGQLAAHLGVIENGPQIGADLPSGVPVGASIASQPADLKFGMVSATAGR